MRRITPKRRGQQREPRRIVIEPQNGPLRLGDRIESALQAIGVTQDRWKELKAELGLPPTCHCPERKAWLNQLDERLGLSEGLEKFKGLLGWK